MGIEWLRRRLQRTGKSGLSEVRPTWLVVAVISLCVCPYARVFGSDPYFSSWSCTLSQLWQKWPFGESNLYLTHQKFGRTADFMLNVAGIFWAALGWYQAVVGWRLLSIRKYMWAASVVWLMLPAMLCLQALSGNLGWEYNKWLGGYSKWNLVLIVPSIICALCATRLAFLLQRQGSTLPAGARCVHCGYPTAGLSGMVCPECGEPPHQVASSARHPPDGLLAALWLAIAMPAAMLLPIAVPETESNHPCYAACTTVGSVAWSILGGPSDRSVGVAIGDGMLHLSLIAVFLHLVAVSLLLVGLNARTVFRAFVLLAGMWGAFVGLQIYRNVRNPDGDTLLVLWMSVPMAATLIIAWRHIRATSSTRASEGRSSGQLGPS